MKTSPFALALAITVAAASGAAAGDKATTDKPTNAQPVEKAKASPVQSQGALKQKDMLLTGSYIKQDIQRSGLITDGPNLVVVIDNKAIRNSGASDVRQVLARYGTGR